MSFPSLVSVNIEWISECMNVRSQKFLLAVLGRKVRILSLFFTLKWQPTQYSFLIPKDGGSLVGLPSSGLLSQTDWKNLAAALAATQSFWGENSNLGLLWHFLKTKEKLSYVFLQGSLQAGHVSYPLKETLFHTVNQSICEGKSRPGTGKPTGQEFAQDLETRRLAAEQ